VLQNGEGTAKRHTQLKLVRIAHFNAESADLRATRIEKEMFRAAVMEERGTTLVEADTRDRTWEDTRIFARNFEFELNLPFKKLGYSC